MYIDMAHRPPSLRPRSRRACLRPRAAARTQPTAAEASPPPSLAHSKPATVHATLSHNTLTD